MQNINKITIFTLLLLSMMTVMSNVAIVTALPHLKNYFIHVANIDFYSKLMLTLSSLVIALLAPILGHIIFKLGKKKCATVALIFFSLTGSAGLYLDSINSLLISRALFGLCVATLMIVSTSLAGDYFKAEVRHKFIGYQSAFNAIGAVIFVTGGGFLSDISWRYSFGIYLIGLLVLPFFLSQIKDIEPTEKEDASSYFNPKVIFVFALTFLYMLVFFILPTQMPFLLIENFHASGKLTGFIIGIALFANAFGAIFFTKLKKKYHFASIFLFAVFIISIGFTGIGLNKNIHLFYFITPILGFGGGIMMTNLNSWMLSYTTNKTRVKTSAYFTSCLFLGQFSSPLVSHPFVATLGVQNFFLAIGVFLFTISFFIVLYLKIFK